MVRLENRNQLPGEEDVDSILTRDIRMRTYLPKQHHGFDDGDLVFVWPSAIDTHVLEPLMWSTYGGC